MKRGILGAILAASTGVAGAEVRLGGIAEVEAAMERGRVQKSELILTPQLEWRAPGFDVTAIARLRTDGYELLGDHTELELRELYLDAYLGRTYLRVGKQQIVWGEADGLKVLDLINPQSFREFILDEFEDSRIPLWSVKWEVPLGGPWNAQFVLVPDQTHHRLPAADDLFAFTSPELVPRPPPGVPVTMQEARVPDDVLADSDAGVQLAAHLGGWDVTLNYLYHYVDFPAVSVARDESGVTVGSRYHRTHTFGGTLSNAFGDFTVRSELGYSTDRRYSATGGGLTTADELSYVIGLDWMGLTDTLVSAQLFQSRADVGDAVARDEWESDATLLVERSFRNRTVTLGVLAIRDLDRGDGVVTGEITYDYQSNVRLRLQVSAFHGSPRGRFGQFDERDRVLVGVEYGF